MGGNTKSRNYSRKLFFATRKKLHQLAFLGEDIEYMSLTPGDRNRLSKALSGKASLKERYLTTVGGGGQESGQNMEPLRKRGQRVLVILFHTDFATRRIGTESTSSPLPSHVPMASKWRMSTLLPGSE